MARSQKPEAQRVMWCLRAVGFRFKPDRGTRKRTTGLKDLRGLGDLPSTEAICALGNF